MPIRLRLCRKVGSRVILDVPSNSHSATAWMLCLALQTGMTPRRGETAFSSGLDWDERQTHADTRADTFAARHVQITAVLFDDLLHAG